MNGGGGSCDCVYHSSVPVDVMCESESKKTYLYLGCAVFGWSCNRTFAVSRGKLIICNGLLEIVRVRVVVVVLNGEV